MKQLINTYALPNGDVQMSPDDIRQALSDFEFFMANYAQIVGKDRRLHPFKLNVFQRMLFTELLPLVKKETRLDRRLSLCVLKPRQVGCTTGLIAFINYICAYLDNFQNTSICHVLPVADTISKLYSKKIEPIITGVHPSIYPALYRENLSSSIVTKYDNIKGIRRQNYYEVVSSGASSVRSDTINISVFDECLSGDVEVLTDKGFRRLDSLDRTEKVAQFNCDTSEISYVKPLRYIDKEYNGDAFEWKYGDGATFISTAMHDFVVGSTKNLRSNTPNFCKRPAYEVVTNDNYTVPVCGIGIGDNTALTAVERLGIATQADGHVVGTRSRRGKRGNSVGWTVCKLQVKRKSKIERMKKLLKESGLMWKIEDNKRSEDGYVTFLYDLPYEDPKRLRTFLSVECGTNRAREILHEVLHWDGYGLDRSMVSGKAYLPESSYYSSIIEDNRDFVAAIALQAGERISTGTQIDGRSDAYRDIHRLYIRKPGRQGYALFSKRAITYTGRVYCVTVPSGAIVVRTGGKVWVCGNCAFYKKPEVVTDAVLGSMPDYGFSLVVYMSTFDTRSNTYFLDKIKTAASGADDWKLIFCPWFLIYPEQPQGIDYHTLTLTEYDVNVIIPAMAHYGVSESKWGDAIDWYHRKSLVIASMLKEYPTTVEEVIQFSEDRLVFNKESMDKQEKNILAGAPHRALTDNQTGKVEMQETEASPFTVFRKPIYGHRYRITIDPITARSEESDFFVMQVMDMANHEQAAIFRGRNLADEDYADWAVSIAKIYNNAELCPEINVANGFIVAVNARRYYHWYYISKKERADRTPGIRTTVSTKEQMIDKLSALLDREGIVIHDQVTLDELRSFVKFVRNNGGAQSIKMAAKKGHHDDTTMALCLYAGSLDMRELERGKKHSFTILGLLPLLALLSGVL